MYNKSINDQMGYFWTGNMGHLWTVKKKFLATINIILFQTLCGLKLLFGFFFIFFRAF
jgi:hypothetical protein